MGKYLDIDDVVCGHPVAKQELQELRWALEQLSDGKNWFHTSDEPGGPHTAWRGVGEPDEIARKALGI